MPQPVRRRRLEIHFPRVRYPRSPQALARRCPAARRAARASDPRPGRGAAVRPGGARPRPRQGRPGGRRPAPSTRWPTELGGMPVDEVLPVARAFSQFLNLANIAEQHHRIRRRRAYQQAPDLPPQRGSCDETFGRLIAAGLSPAALRDAVCSLQIELVLTAHPTEVVRRTLLQKYDRIAAALAEKRPARPDAVGARDRRRDAAPRDRRLLGDRRDPPRPPDAARRSPRRAARVRADAVAGAAALPARARSGPDAAHRLGPAARGRRRSASARGSAAIATATRTSRRR